MAYEYAGVRLLDAPYCIDREYDYRIPEGMDVRPGAFVSVPFGGGNRNRLALVTRVSNRTEAESGGGERPLKIKPIYAVCSADVTFDGEMLGILEFVRSRTLCTTGDAVHAMIPAAALSRLVEYYTVTDKPLAFRTAPDNRCLMIRQYAAERGQVSLDTLKYRFGDVSEEIATLLSGGYLARTLEVREPAEKTESSYTLSPTLGKEGAEKLLSGDARDENRKKIRFTSVPQQAALRRVAEASGPVAEKELTEGSPEGITRQHLNALVRRGWLERKESRVARDLMNADRSPGGTAADVILNKEQQEAYDVLARYADSGEAHGVLLEGVTGSGKTCVMLRIIDKMLAARRGVILLLPEIALTPQSLRIFCSRYGDRVAVLHSELSAGERYDAYTRIRSGGADLVIGTRSAVFAPVRDLGLIIIDEEQEHTYKSDMSPRYHARDVARYRCARNRAVMLLASATPSVESRKKAEDGAYTLIRMTHRYGNAVLPDVTIADMRQEPRDGNLTPIGRLLTQKLRETYERGEQSILFLNRRGYNNYVSCASCGEAILCPGCSVSMTYHTRRGTYAEGELVCHWCGRRMSLPDTCPGCGSDRLIRMGYGTQRVEEELQRLLPGARILRMDTDSVSGRGSYGELLGQFRRHEADVLLGTQMVTKGHDFPDVTLVGVLLADASLYYDDFRAAERTFALLTQVIGRAGRRDKPGEAVIQTNNPDHDVIKLARAQDYETFYARDVAVRRALTFPPFCDIALLTVTSENEHEAVTTVRRLAERMREKCASEPYRELPVILFGPFEAPVYRVENRYRMRLIVKCRLNADARRLFSEISAEFTRDGKGPLLSVDFNPTSL